MVKMKRYIPLMQAGDARSTEVDGDYIVFLEDYTLEPGDVISYYVEGEELFRAAWIGGFRHVFY